MHANPPEWKGYGPLPPEPTIQQEEESDENSKKVDDGKVKGHWNKRLTSFQKLVFTKAFQEEKVM